MDSQDGEAFKALQEDLHELAEQVNLEGGADAFAKVWLDHDAKYVGRSLMDRKLLALHSIKEIVFPKLQEQNCAEQRIIFLWQLLLQAAGFTLDEYDVMVANLGTNEIREDEKRDELPNSLPEVSAQEPTPKKPASPDKLNQLVPMHVAKVEPEEARATRRSVTGVVEESPTSRRMRQRSSVAYGPDMVRINRQIGENVVKSEAENWSTILGNPGGFLHSMGQEGTDDLKLQQDTGSVLANTDSISSASGSQMSEPKPSCFEKINKLRGRPRKRRQIRQASCSNSDYKRRRRNRTLSVKPRGVSAHRSSSSFAKNVVKDEPACTNIVSEAFIRPVKAVLLLEALHDRLFHLAHHEVELDYNIYWETHRFAYSPFLEHKGLMEMLWAFKRTRLQELVFFHGEKPGIQLIWAQHLIDMAKKRLITSKEHLELITDEVDLFKL